MIIAFTSSTNTPLSAQDDASIDLQGGATLPQNVQLYGAGTDSEDNTPAFTFSWTILQKPAGSTAILDDATLQNPTLQNVDVWGNYRLMLILTNTNSGNTSDNDIITAPNTAFVQVRVQSQNLGLEKVATGERNWTDKAHEWVDALENHESRLDTIEAYGLDDLQDVTLGTLSNSEILVYNGTVWENQPHASDADLIIRQNSTDYTLTLTDEKLTFANSDNNLTITPSEDVDGNITITTDFASTVTTDFIQANDTIVVNADNTADDAIIQFRRGDIETPEIAYDQSASTFTLKRNNTDGHEEILTREDVPTGTERAGVLQTSGYSYNTLGKILDVERLVFSQVVDGDVDYKSATAHNATINDEILAYDSANLASHCIILFKNNTAYDLKVYDVDLVLASAGILGVGTEYSFSFRQYTSFANLASDTALANAGGNTYTFSVGNINRIGDNQPLNANWNATNDNSGTEAIIGANHWFGIRVETAPQYTGNRLFCTISAFKLVS